MDQPTIMTEEHRQMLAYWQVNQPTINVESLAGHLIRRFNLNKNTAWVLAARFINERRAS
jgi:hypothetical protein